jgi:hypothetical protein
LPDHGEEGSNDEKLASLAARPSVVARRRMRVSFSGARCGADAAAPGCLSREPGYNSENSRSIRWCARFGRSCGSGAGWAVCRGSRRALSQWHNS